jgi:hypothetical protein
MDTRSFGVMEYHHGRWNQQPVRRVESTSHEDAARQVDGDGLTLVGCSRIRGLHYLVAKVWDGGAFYYAYRYPTGMAVA